MIDNLVDKYLCEMVKVKKGQVYRIQKGFTLRNTKSYERGKTIKIEDVFGPQIVFSYGDYARLGDTDDMDYNEFRDLIDTHKIDRELWK